MKNKKIITILDIILSIIVLLIELCLYIKTKNNFAEISSANHEYTNAGLMIIGLMRSAVLMWGALLIPIIWLKYFLINLSVKIYNKYNGLKRLFLCLIISIIILILLMLFIWILYLIISFL